MEGVDPSAVVEASAVVGPGVLVRRLSHVREGARIAAETRIGAGVYVGAGVVVGARCKVQNGAQLFEGTVLGDRVFVGPGVILTNDRHPRAVGPDGRLQAAADWDEVGVTVHEGASIGAGVVVVAGVTIGAWAMVGAGAVVTRDVDPYALVVGNPARPVGRVCRCGTTVHRSAACDRCGDRYDGGVDGGIGSTRR